MNYNRMDLPVFEGHGVAGGRHADDAQGRLCAGCGIDMYVYGAEWRICRCGVKCCVICARNACPGCATQYVYREEHDDGNYDDIYTHDLAAIGMDESVLEHHAGQETDTDPQGTLLSPLVFTPEGAAQRRREMQERHMEELKERRAQQRQATKRQRRQYRRPAREGTRGDVIKYCTCNVNAANTFQEELAHGDTLHRMDGIMLQEHGMGKEKCEEAALRMRRKGWDPVVAEAYVKHTSFGGGVAVLTSERAGLRPLAVITGLNGLDVEVLKGRFTFGVTSDLGGIVNASVYGISGLPVTAQLRLWRAVAMQLRLAGLPFVVGGDWQVTPHEMQLTRVPELIGAVIVATKEPTNTHTMRTIDYFLVSKSIAPLVKSVEVVSGARFSPHALVVLCLQGKRSLGLARRVAQPKLLDVNVPVGPMPAGIRINWDGYLRPASSTGGEESGVNQTVTDENVDQWFAGAEAELLTLFGLAGGSTEAYYSGVGRPIREVEGTVGPSRRETPDALGKLGHRLTWTARAIHLVVRWAGFLAPEGEPLHGHTFRNAEVGGGDDGQQARRRKIARMLSSYGSRAIAFLKEKLPVNSDDDEAEACRTLQQALRLMASTVRPCHGKPPLIEAWLTGQLDRQVEKFTECEARLAKAIGTITRARRSKETKVVKAQGPTQSGACGDEAEGHGIPPHSERGQEPSWRNDGAIGG